MNITRYSIEDIFDKLDLSENMSGEQTRNLDAF